LQLKCCGVFNQSDLSSPEAIWNRTNPWYTSGSNADTMNFTYPITCCNLGDSYTSNWDNLPTGTLESYASCALNGTGLHTSVREICLEGIFNIINRF